MGNGRRGRWIARVLRSVALALFLLPIGCGRTVSEGDAASARSVVDKAVRSASYEDFLSCFTQDKRERMAASAVWIRWWRLKIGADPMAWKTVGVRGLKDERIEIVTQHRKIASSRQYYRLVRERGVWRIYDMESER